MDQNLDLLAAVSGRSDSRKTSAGHDSLLDSASQPSYQTSGTFTVTTGQTHNDDDGYPGSVQDGSRAAGLVVSPNTSSTTSNVGTSTLGSGGVQTPPILIPAAARATRESPGHVPVTVPMGPPMAPLAASAAGLTWPVLSSEDLAVPVTQQQDASSLQQLQQYQQLQQLQQFQQFQQLQQLQQLQQMQLQQLRLQAQVQVNMAGMQAGVVPTNVMDMKLQPVQPMMMMPQMPAAAYGLQGQYGQPMGQYGPGGVMVPAGMQLVSTEYLRAAQNQSRKRKRVELRPRSVNACVNCRAGKVACDDTRPCHRCIRLGKEATCKDSVHKKRGRKSRPGEFDGSGVGGASTTDGTDRTSGTLPDAT